jgi:hypothetical protein
LAQLGKIPPDGAPCPVFALAGILRQLFAYVFLAEGLIMVHASVSSYKRPLFTRSSAMR